MFFGNLQTVSVVLLLSTSKRWLTGQAENRKQLFVAALYHHALNRSGMDQRPDAEQCLQMGKPAGIRQVGAVGARYDPNADRTSGSAKDGITLVFQTLALELVKVRCRLLSFRDLLERVDHVGAVAG